MRPFAAGLGLGVTLFATGAAAQEPFSYHEPGDLIPGSGEGLPETEVFAPGMRFPIGEGPAWANSQVYMHGGAQGPGGSQCDAENYAYPWRDNYCEVRSWDMPLCPAGTGHQGQDIRPPTCEAGVHDLVAAAAGTITNIGSYSVYLTAPDGTRFDYLHGSAIAVQNGQGMAPGEPIGKVSNEFGGTPTTIHLHFNIRQDVGGVGFVYVSPYMSLVESYKELMGLTGTPPDGFLDESGCEAIRGWAQDPDAPEDPVTVRIHLDAPAGNPEALVIELAADLYREDLCDALGSCEHGFELEIPRSLRDGTPHPIFAYAVDDEGTENVELQQSPGELDCPPPPIPPGVRRLVSSPEVLAAWQLSPLWDLAKVDDATLAAIDEGPALGPAPLLVHSDDEPETIWLIDQGFRRAIDPAAMEAWRLTGAEVLEWPAASVDGVPLGTPLPEGPFMVQGAAPEMWVIDDEQCNLDAPGCGEDDSAEEGGTAGTDETAGAAEAEPGAGCGCGAVPGGGAGWLAVAFVRRRRR